MKIKIKFKLYNNSYVNFKGLFLSESAINPIFPFIILVRLSINTKL